MAAPDPFPAGRYRWATAGDINAFFGLMLDNIAALVLLVGLLAMQGVPAEFSLRYMIPGTAFGVLFGDLTYTLMAFRLARRTGRSDVTAMPLGLDTPATFGIVLFVLGPAFQTARERGLDVAAASHFTWQVGICTLLVSGLFKLVCALGAGWVRRLFPRAGLLGSLSAVALVLISFIPLLDILHDPIVGLVALSIVLTTLVARVDLPLRIPGALGALIVGSAIYYLMHWMHRSAGVESATAPLASVWFPTEWFGAMRGDWMSAMRESLAYLPVAIPFALATVVGGIDCSESAAAVGDDYNTGQVVAVEGLATLVAALCGGVVQTTPYIGHPAYKAMGGRAAYTLATALFVGGAGIVGYFSTIYAILPLAAVYPILVFIGLEITAQSFAATPQRHYPAVALACVPAMAYLIMIYVDQLLGESHTGLDSLSARFAQQITTLRLLGGGFIITSLLWGSTLAALIDRRLATAAAFLALAGAASFFGVIHSLHPGTPIGLPWNLPESQFGPSPYVLAIGYAAAAAMLMAWSWWVSVGTRNSEG
jgi:AGZA family xanthine/uracil permease-like MFS transporter